MSELSRADRLDLMADAYKDEMETPQDFVNKIHEAATALRAMEWVSESERLPGEGHWVVIEITDDAGTDYLARKHDPRHWPSFGVRWRYIDPPTTET